MAKRIIRPPLLSRAVRDTSAQAFAHALANEPKSRTEAWFAEKIGVTQQTISYWKKEGVPSHRLGDIEEAFEGRITRQKLRPDLFE